MQTVTLTLQNAKAVADSSRPSYMTNALFGSTWPRPTSLRQIRTTILGRCTGKKTTRPNQGQALGSPWFYSAQSCGTN
jgi:hypothetical protein